MLYYKNIKKYEKPFTEVTLPSGSSRGNSVEVQVLLPAPTEKGAQMCSLFRWGVFITGLEGGAVMNDMPVACQNRD
jgi:hypothetical protein